MTFHIKHTTLFMGIGVVSVTISLGCSSDTIGPGINNNPAAQYWQLSLNHHAVTMALTAPYDTITLTATPRTVTGTPMAETGTVRYTIDYSNDDCGCQSVTVSPTGLVTADSVDEFVNVIATWTIGGVDGLTLADTAMVNVNDVSPVPVFTTLTLQPQPGDSAKYGRDMGVYEVFVNATINPIVLDAQGQVIPIVNFYITNSDSIDFGREWSEGQFAVDRSKVGRSLYYAEATVYGVTKKSSLLYTVTEPNSSVVGVFPRTPKGSVTPIGFFSPGDDTIAAGGAVIWQNALNDQPIDVVFDNPTAVQSVDSAKFSNGIYGDNQGGDFVLPNQGGGNIPSFSPFLIVVDTAYNHWNKPSLNQLDTLPGVRARSFPVAGTYSYHSALYGTAGVIHVVVH